MNILMLVDELCMAGTCRKSSRFMIYICVRRYINHQSNGQATIAQDVFNKDRMELIVRWKPLDWPHTVDM
jgi:hypothetical protein